MFNQFLSIDDLINNIKRGDIGFTADGTIAYKTKTGYSTFVFSDDSKILSLVKDQTNQQIINKLNEYIEITLDEKVNEFAEQLYNVSFYSDEEFQNSILSNKSLIKLNNDEIKWNDDLNGFVTNKNGFYNKNDKLEISNNLFIPQGFNGDSYKKINNNKTSQLIRLDEEGRFLYFVSNADGELNETFIINPNGSIETTMFSFFADEKDLFVKIGEETYNITSKISKHSDLEDVKENDTHIDNNTLSLLKSLLSQIDKLNNFQFVKKGQNGDLIESDIKEEGGVLYSNNWVMSERLLALNHEHNAFKIDVQQNLIQLINKNGKSLTIKNEDGDLYLSGDIFAEKINDVPIKLENDEVYINNTKFATDQDLAKIEKHITDKINVIKELIISGAKKENVVASNVSDIKIEPLTIAKYSALNLTSDNILNFNFDEDEFQIIDGKLTSKHSYITFDDLDDITNSIKEDIKNSANIIEKKVNKKLPKFPLQKTGDKEYFIDGNISTNSTPVNDNHLATIDTVKKIAASYSGGGGYYDGGNSGGGKWGEITGDVNNQLDLQMEFDKFLKKDGSVQVDQTFTPSLDYDIVYKKYVEDYVAAAVSAISSASGSQYNYSLNIAAPPYAEIFAGGTNDTSTIDTGWKVTENGFIKCVTLKTNKIAANTKMNIYINEQGNIASGTVQPTLVSTNDSGTDNTVIFEFNTVALSKGDIIRINLDNWSNNPAAILFYSSVSNGGGGESPGGNIYYNNPNPTPEAIHGIAKGSTFDNRTLQEMWDDLLYPYQTPNFTLFHFGWATPLEVGASTPENPTATWNIENPENVTEDSISILDLTAGTTIKDNLANDGTENLILSPITKTSATNNRFRIKALNTNNIEFSKDYVVYWQWRRFYGENTATSINEDGVHNLRVNQLAASFEGTYNFQGGGYKYIAYPSLFGTATSFIDPTTQFNVPFNDPYTVQVTNSYGITTNYNVHRSTNVMAAPIAVEVK